MCTCSSRKWYGLWFNGTAWRVDRDARYAPVKNNVEAAQKKFAKGLPTHGAAEAEMSVYAGASGVR